MADEIIPPGDENAATNPTDRPNDAENAARAPAPRRPPTPPAPTTLEWLKIEAAHVGLLLALGVLAFGGVYFLGYDTRVAVIAGVAVVLLGRGLTSHILPDHPVRGSSSSAEAPPTDSVREIIEMIVFVVVLVLLLKSFVAEAFVIPTGSMATTLWGYQKVVDCPECGYRFPVNSSSEADPQDNQRPIPVVGCTCPNCRYNIEFATEARKHPGWEVPTWSSGDRVLVAKFLYDLLGRQPERLDVVVFKFPGDASPSTPWPRSGPFSQSHVPINYIKRLVGEPGEVIAVHAGNLYRIPKAKVPEDIREQFVKDAEDSATEGAKQLWQTGPRGYTHTQTGAEAREFFENNHDLFQIVRKPPETMLAMRRIVYDNDHPARDLNVERWGGWPGAGRAFAHAADQGEEWLRYQNVLRGTGGKPQLVTDFMGYNSAVLAGFGSNRQTGVNWVSDLMVECDAKVEKAEGTLTLELSRGVDRFQARFELPTGNCKLVRITGDVETEVAAKATGVKKPGTYHLRFADFDQRLTVWVDNALPFGDGVDFPEGKEGGPRKENDLDRPASIGASGAAVRVDHLQLWRDTYYTVAADGSPSEGDVSSVDFGNPDTWSRLKPMPVRVMRVQPGHYLCMGDNSPESSDGRAWGLVPERLLLGRALLVYYPFNRAGRIR
jgi:signal peptidase I